MTDKDKKEIKELYNSRPHYKLMDAIDNSSPMTDTDRRMMEHYSKILRDRDTSELYQSIRNVIYTIIILVVLGFFAFKILLN